MRNMSLNLAAIVGLLLACYVEAQENQVFSYTVSAHNAPMTVDLIVKDGKIATGWQTWDGNKYYMNSDGSMRSNEWRLDDTGKIRYL